MDRATFLLKREEIQQRMDERRAYTVQEVQTVRSRFFPRVLMTGAGLVSGVSSSPTARKLIKTLIWAAAAPVVINILDRHHDGLVHRVIDALLPARPKEPAEK